MLVILSGASGSGKATIKKELLKRNANIISLPSYTDRKPRPGEVDGIEYNFISTEEFENLIKNDDLYEYDKHHNNYYGTSKSILNEKIKTGKIIIKDIEENGTENLLKLLKDKVKIVTIFLKVPKDVLKKRLIERNLNLSIEDIERRLNRFEYEESKINLYDYVIKNNDLEKTLSIISTIIESEKNLEESDF